MLNSDLWLGSVDSFAIVGRVTVGVLPNVTVEITCGRLRLWHR